MRVYRFLLRIGLIALFLGTVATEIFRNSRPGSADDPAPSRWKVGLKGALVGIAVFIALQAIGGLVLVASGVYNIAADQPHFEPVAWLLKTASTRSVLFHTTAQRIPNLRDPMLVKQGLGLYRKNCQPCHGAPGVANDVLGRGINPKPPALTTAADKWTDLQLFWITSHGLKMSGMPGFDGRLSETDRWAITAFLRRMELLSPAEYARLTEAADHGESDETVAWIPDNDAGFHEFETQGNSARGRDLLRGYGCITCHTIPGIGDGLVGPPLSNFSERQYIAGLAVNVPNSLVRWIENPKQFKKVTAMPNLNVRPHEALDMAAYLYTLGSRQRLTMLKQVVGVTPLPLSRM